MNTTDPDPQPIVKACKLHQVDKNLIFPGGVVAILSGTYSGEPGTHYRIRSEEHIPTSDQWGYRLATADRPQSREVEIWGEEVETIDGVDWYSYYFRFIE